MIKKPAILATTEPSYDTKIIIVVLLLVFIYPLGLLMMWTWMRSWPLWLRSVISIPFFIAIMFMIFIFILIHNSFRSNTTRGHWQPYQYHMQTKPQINLKYY